MDVTHAAGGYVLFSHLGRATPRKFLAVPLRLCAERTQTQAMFMGKVIG